MLGKFLELSVVTAATGEAWAQFRKLGFAEATAGDVWPHAYGVVTCEELAIGLHATGDEPLSLAFVRPEVAALHRELEARHIGIDSARLGNDVFNELALREPGGLLLRVLEARSFSPPLSVPKETVLGRFRAISLPCPDLAAAREFWEQLGAGVSVIEDPWEGIAVTGPPLAYHQRRSGKEPLLLFDHHGAPDQHALREAGVSIARPLPGLRDRGHLLSRGVEGLALLTLL